MRVILSSIVLSLSIGCICPDKRPIIKSMKLTLQKTLEDYESGKVKLGPLATKSRILRIKTDIKAAEEAGK